MEEQQLTPKTAFEIVYNATGALQLNRTDARVLDAALRVLAGLIPGTAAEFAEE
ncbi:hypothetical protein [Pedobacter steynii]|uniref:hypothetical protein n=1 Tax=Pedobacter steynii TaxID=430522 RepID=UPI0012FB5B57|nr:hypothetical protein [Pedobacter steynii]